MSCGKAITAEEIARIRRVFGETRSCERTGRALGFSKSTVAAYTADMRGTPLLRDRAEEAVCDAAENRPRRITPAEWRLSRFVPGFQPKWGRA